jgi:hypothetical protein
VEPPNVSIFPILFSRGCSFRGPVHLPTPYPPTLRPAAAVTTSAYLPAFPVRTSRAASSALFLFSLLRPTQRSRTLPSPPFFRSDPSMDFNDLPPSTLQLALLITAIIRTPSRPSPHHPRDRESRHWALRGSWAPANSPAEREGKEEAWQPVLGAAGGGGRVAGSGVGRRGLDR